MQGGNRLKPPVIIVGAHRSGTTATARALRLLGLQLGHRLDSHDEPRQMQRLHEQYLSQIGAAWHNPDPFLASIATAAGKSECVNYLRNSIDDNFSTFGYEKGLTGRWLKSRLRSGKPWGWKEPRTTLFASCWLEIFPAARFCHVVRNPLAVATSIQRRELEFQAKGDAPSGRVGDFEYCIELALKYVGAGEALADLTSNYRRIRFEDIQSDPVRELAALASFCGVNFVDSQMRRAAATIRPTRPETVREIDKKTALLGRYPLAEKLGYSAAGSSRNGGFPTAES